jgi:sugar fermentation stimulation protein A
MLMISIPLAGPLVEARFVERPNRFLLRCDVAADHAVGDVSAHGGRAGAIHESEGASAPDEGNGDDAARAGLRTVEAHLADPGRLRELLLPGRRLWLRPVGSASGAKRRTAWTAVLVQAPDGAGLVSVDTTLPNRLVHAALQADALPELAGWRLLRREVRLGASRIDFLLGDDAGRTLALEVKSVTLVEDRVALFPDAVTARGARHVRELREHARDGGYAAVLFVLQRPDAERIVAARSIDPVFADALAEAEAAGVRVLGRRCDVSLQQLTLREPVPAGSA